MVTDQWRIKSADPEQIRQLMADFGLSRLVATAMTARGITAAHAESYLHPKLQDLCDPYLVPDMETAAARLWRAIHDREQILIHGDYDTDGITSTVLLEWVLRENGAEVDCFLPHRINDGYGLTPESIDRATDANHRLLVTVDCGITSVAAARAAADMGLDVIITDHHQPGDELPVACAVINPKLHPHLRHLHQLAGVGVCFKLCHAFLKYGREHDLGGHHVDLREGLDLVALGTIADIVPLVGENRCLVRHGMKVVSAQRRPGIRALCDITGLNERVRPEDIAFRLTPRLNAAGRLGDAADALALLRAESIVDAYPLARQLDTHNRNRQKLESSAFQDALDQIGDGDMSDQFAIVVQGESWHPGVIGIVASRLTQTFNRPAIVLTTDDDGQMQGSGRGVPGVNLVDALEPCRELLSRFGGHPMAVGLSLAREAYATFQCQFEASIRDIRGGVPDFARTIELDADAQLSELDDRFFAQIEDMQPFGHGNPQPCFLFRNLGCQRVLHAGKHNSRGQFEDRSGRHFAFIAFGRTTDDWPEPPWDVAGLPQLNYYHGRCTPQIQVTAVRNS